MRFSGRLKSLADRVEWYNALTESTKCKAELISEGIKITFTRNTEQTSRVVGYGEIEFSNIDVLEKAYHEARREIERG